MSTLHSGELDTDVGGGAESSPDTVDKTSDLRSSLPSREEVRGFTKADTPSLQGDNQASRDMQAVAGNNELVSPLSASVDKSATIIDEESHAHKNTGNLPHRDLGFEVDEASAAEGSIFPQATATDYPDNGMDSPKSQDPDPAIDFAETHGAKTRVSGHDETVSVSSPAIPRDMPASVSSNHETNTMPKVEVDTGQPGGDENVTSLADINSTAQAEVARTTDADDQPHSASNISIQGTLTKLTDRMQMTDLTSSDSSHRVKSNSQRHSESASNEQETVTSQADATPTITLPTSESNHQVQSSMHEATLEPSVPSFDISARPTLGPGATAVTHVLGANGDLQHSDDARVDNTSSPLSVKIALTDNSLGRNEEGKTLADGGITDQVSQRVNKQLDMKNLSKQEVIPQRQKLAETKDVHRDAQGVFPPLAPMATQGSPNLNPASFIKSADKKITLTASSTVPAASVPSSPEPQLTQATKPSTHTEALRSVPATPFQTSLFPMTGDAIHSRPPVRSVDKNLAEPNVQIGQIDVIIEAAAQPAAKSAPSPSTIDLASRYYLKSL